jgi:hypothetical protein
MNLSVAPTQFTEGEALELTEYRPVNRFAVLSAIFGGLSGFTLLHPMLLVLPLVGAAAGFIAYWQLSVPNPLQSGKTAAKWGIFLSLLFGICMVTATASRDRLLARQARSCAEHWFQLISEGKLQAAHQLTLPSLRRSTSEADLKEYYKPKERKSRLPSGEGSPGEMSEMLDLSGQELFDQLFSRPIMKRLAEFGNNATYEYLGTVSHIQTGPSSLSIVQQFGVTQRDGVNTERLVVEITLERTEDRQIANWRVDESIREL